MTIQGKPLGRGQVQWITPELRLRISCMHEETLAHLVLEEAKVDIVLGHPWLAQHQPTICWSNGQIQQWSNSCISSCLHVLPTPTPKPVLLGSMNIESPPTCTEVDLPAEYRDYNDVFSKTAATLLPPHRSWDCAIDLLPDTKMPKGLIYPQSVLERKAMEEYIKEALHQGFIHPSHPPCPAGTRAPPPSPPLPQARQVRVPPDCRSVFGLHHLPGRHQNGPV